MPFRFPVRRRRLLAPLAVTCAATLLAAVVASPSTAQAAPLAGSFDSALQTTFRVCVKDSVRTMGRYVQLDPAAVYACLGSRGYSAVVHSAAGPNNLTSRTPEPTRFEIDLFSTFTSCLSEAAHPDSMYPGIDPDEVNNCLDNHGFW